jgi:hypothetical protein
LNADAVKGRLAQNGVVSVKLVVAGRSATNSTPATREVHASPLGYSLIDIAKLLSKIANSIFAAALLNVFLHGFTG